MLIYAYICCQVVCTYMLESKQVGTDMLYILASCMQQFILKASRSACQYVSIKCVTLYAFSICRGKLDRTAESVSTDVWNAIAQRTGLHDVPVVPEPANWAKHVAHAQAMRDYMDRESKRAVCGVCSMHRRAEDVDLHSIGAIPNLQLLSSNGEQSEKYPRHALTTFEHHDSVFCLQPHACVEADDGDVNVRVCKSCFNHLAHGRIPPESLVCFDAGMPIYL
jgi:hypothetical protein